jgi:hypothetical protein
VLSCSELPSVALESAPFVTPFVTRSGELDGIDRGYDMPRSTYFKTLARVKQRMLDKTFPRQSEGGGLLLEQLAREDDDALLAIAPRPLPVPSTVSRVPGPEQTAEARRTALIARLEALAESAG